MSRKSQYPFLPKSTAYLEPGQFWAIALANGTFAAGRVLQTAKTEGAFSRRLFHGGLMSWHGKGLPQADDLAGCEVIEEGQMHVVAITDHGPILGIRPLELDGIQPRLFLNQSADSPSCAVYRGLTRVRHATARDRATLQTYSTWGRAVIRIHAERHFVKHA